MRQSELRTVDADRQLVLRQDPDGVVVSADLPGGNGFGWSATELSELSLNHLIHPDDRVVVERGRAWSMASGNDQTLNLRVRAPGGRWQWYEATVRSVGSPADAAPIEIALRDISEIALSQEALTIVIGLRNYIDTASDVEDVLVEAARRIMQFAHFDRAYVWEMSGDTPGTIGAVGDIAAPPRVFDDGVDTVLVDSFNSVTPVVVTGRRSRDSRAAAETEVSVIVAPMVSRGETLAVFEFESHRVLGGKGVVSLVGDVLDQLADAVRRKRVEVELDIAQQQLAVAFSDAAIGMVFTTIDGSFTRVNRAAAELLDRSVENLLAMNIGDVSHPDDRDLDVAMLDEILAGTRDRFQVERRFVRPDGSVTHTLSSVAVVRESDGVPLHLINQLVDISAQKAREFLVDQKSHPPQPGSTAVIEALDAFLQAQAAAGLPTGVVWIDLIGATGDGERSAVRHAMDELRQSTRNGDYFAPIDDRRALIAIAAFGDDRQRLSDVVSSVGQRIRAHIDNALASCDGGAAVEVLIRTGIEPSESARASDLVSSAYSTPHKFTTQE